MEKSTAQILQEGRARIVQGWCQGDMHTQTTRGHQYCALGAVWCPAEPHEEGLAVRATRALEAALPGAWREMGLAPYNDAPERTRADILALYDRALSAVTK